MRASLVWGCLRLARLPSLLPPPVVDPEAEARFAAVADELLAGEPVAIPEPRLEFLRWLAENRPVVFHGSLVTTYASCRPNGSRGTRRRGAISRPSMHSRIRCGRIRLSAS